MDWSCMVGGSWLVTFDCRGQDEAKVRSTEAKGGHGAMAPQIFRRAARFFTDSGFFDVGEILD